MTTRSTRFTAPRLTLPLVGLLTALATGCGQGSSPSGESPALVTAPAPARADAAPPVESDVASQVAALRAATARFQSFEAADAAGYSTQILGCMTDPPRGGLGFHFGTASGIDNTENPLEPEVLLYEPQINGRPRLVAVEFILPYEVRPRNGPVPVLFGQPFVPTDDLGLWALHAWVWRHNPSGMFADWNPEVNCDAAPAASRTSHASH